MQRRLLLISLAAAAAALPARLQAQGTPPAATELLRPQEVRPLPGGLDRVPMVNDNNPEVVKGPGILLSTFEGRGRGVPAAHLDVPLEGPFELFSHHIFAGQGREPSSTLWLGVVVGNRSDRPVRLRVPSGASWLSQPDAPFLPLPGQLEHDGTSVYAGPGGRVAGDLLAGVPRPAGLPAELTLAPRATDLLLALPVPVRGLDPLLNGRTLQLRLDSDGPVSLATLALISGEAPPSRDSWLALLEGDLSEKEHPPTPRGAPGRIVYSRVSGVQTGSRWKAVLSDPGRQDLVIGDRPVSWPLASLVGGTLGTGQVQSAPLRAFYPGTSWEAHGNYGVLYDLELPLHNPSAQPQTLSLGLEMPLKSDRNEGGLRFRQPPGAAVFFRGSVELRGLPSGGRRFLHLVRRQGEAGESLTTVSLAPGERRRLRVRLIIPADITPVPVLTVAPVKQSGS